MYDERLSASRNRAANKLFLCPKPKQQLAACKEFIILSAPIHVATGHGGALTRQTGGLPQVPGAAPFAGTGPPGPPGRRTA
jgi:hypothetical protein